MPLTLRQQLSAPEYRLATQIINLSESNLWSQAKLEWELDSIFITDHDSAGTCLCGHFPILEHCIIRNRVNGRDAVVGNVCIGRYLRHETRYF